MASFGLNILKAYNSDSDTGESCDEGVNDSEGTTATSVSSSSPQLKNNVIISSRKRGNMKEDSILLQSVKRRRTDASGQHEICSNATSLPNSFSNNNNNNNACTTGEPEGEKDDPGLVRRLPSVPSHILQMFPDETATRQDDDPSLHLGRVRTFPHVRGNWATYIYIQLPETAPLVERLNHLINATKKTMPCAANESESLHVINDKHLSLSRTLQFRHHWIDSFTSNLKKACSGIPGFDLYFDEFDAYTNDEKTRTFISMKASGSKTLLDLVEKCDDCLADFQLEPYYKDPSFHISCAWMLGDHRSWAQQNLLPVLRKKWDEAIMNDPELQIYPVSSFELKTGNQLYRFFLRK